MAGSNGRSQRRSSSNFRIWRGRDHGQPPHTFRPAGNAPRNGLVAGRIEPGAGEHEFSARRVPQLFGLLGFAPLGGTGAEESSVRADAPGLEPAVPALFPGSAASPAAASSMTDNAFLA